MRLKSIQDEPGTMREYETVFILRPDSSHDTIALVNAKLRNIIEQLGGRVLKLENWGKRKLAYEVKKHLKGIYMYWSYLGNSGLIEEIERNFRMMESVIRYLTVNVAKNVDASSKVAGVTEETYIKAATTIPDEEEMLLGSSSARFHKELSDDLDMHDEYHPDVEEMKLQKGEVIK